ncbi:MAG TPA: hypothetical protein VN633_19080 [Bryobacteraceae bacterium]|nr:hypothetical protein [Bryobacteraceae bacterium]
MYNQTVPSVWTEGLKLRVLPGVPDAHEVRRELDLILGSVVFRGSKRCQDFLRYVATKSLDGAADTLKERTLAVEVFGRHADSDLSDDSIVRVGAREVRKRLAQYYVGEGAHDQVRIDLPAGSYVPAFHYWAEDASEGTSVAAVVPNVQVTDLPSIPHANTVQRGHRGWLWASGAVLLVAILVLAWQFSPRAVSAFDTFWAPVFQSRKPVLLVMAHPIVYHPSSRAEMLDAERNGIAPLPLERPIHLPPNMLDGSDMVPIVDQYVGLGDAMAALRFGTLAAQHSHPAGLRLANRVEFNDLRDSAPILIGAFTNRWTVEITKEMRYRFLFRNQKPCFIDSKSGKVWELASKTDNGHSAEDYVLICRLPHSKTGGFMLIGAGLNVYGTEEAGRIMTDHESLRPILAKLPPDWASKNLELILHVEVVGDAPAMPELVAATAW